MSARYCKGEEGNHCEDEGIKKCIHDITNTYEKETITVLQLSFRNAQQQKDSFEKSITIAEERERSLSFVNF